MKLGSVDLLALQTAAMKQDPTTKAMSAAVTPELNKVSGQINKCLITSRINELSEDVLDELAFEYHVDWYDYTASIEVKRALIKNSDKVHMYLGTDWAVEQVVQDYFGDGKVENWYEYDGGEPGHFRIVTNNAAVTGDAVQKLITVLRKVKRKSAWLDEIIVVQNTPMNIRYGFAVHIGDFMTVRQGV